MELSILIPVRNDIRIINCIESIDEDVEVIVVLNDATDEVTDIVANLGVKIVSIPEANLSKAYNAGITAAKYENVLLMDSDCVFKKGTIKKLYNGMTVAKLSKGMVVFKKKGIVSSTISKVRSFTTSDFCNAFSPPLILNKSISSDIGDYFNPELKWEEDYEFNMRVARAGIKIYWDKTAIVFHPPLSLKHDLLSAKNYGKSHGVGIEIGVFPKIIVNDEWKTNQRTQNQEMLKRKGLLSLMYYKLWKRVYYSQIPKEYFIKENH